VREDVQRLCDLFAELMRRNDPLAKVAPTSKAWRDPMRLLIDTDGRSPDVIERVIRWTQADDFQRCIVLSPGKLHKRFGELMLKAQAANGALGLDPNSTKTLARHFARERQERGGAA